MGQKSSPLALRLQTNRRGQALWQSARTYPQWLHHSLQLHAFLAKVFRQAGTRAVLAHLTHAPARTQLHAFFVSPRHLDPKAETKVVALQPTPFFRSHQSTHHPFLPDQLAWARFGPKVWFQRALHPAPLPPVLPALAAGAGLEGPTGLAFYGGHLEGVSQGLLGTPTTWAPIQLRSCAKSAAFVAALVAQGLETQKPWKPLLGLVQTLLQGEPGLEGYRIACAGRLQGVEMAKTEVKSWGRVPLNTLASKVDVAQARASTGFGILGVKVWLCYRA